LCRWLRRTIRRSWRRFGSVRRSRWLGLWPIIRRIRWWLFGPCRRRSWPITVVGCRRTPRFCWPIRCCCGGSRFARRSLLHHRRAWADCGAYFGQLWSSQRHTGTLLENLLTRGEWRRCWRWRRPGNHRSTDNCSGRRCHSIRSVGVNSQHRLLRRRDGGSGNHRSPCKLLRIDGNRAARYWLRSPKRLLRDGRHASVNVPVYIREVVDRRIVSDNRRVIDVRNCCLVDRGVRDVDPIHICRTHVIGRNVDFARTEREPGDGRANGNAASDERDQGRRIHRAFLTGAGHPTPATIEARPAAVVERRISPRVVVHPSPSPRIDPGPMPVMIRGPASAHPREPNVAVLGIRSPVAVLVEIFESHGAARAVTSRN